MANLGHATQFSANVNADGGETRKCGPLHTSKHRQDNQQRTSAAFNYPLKLRRLLLLWLSKCALKGLISR